MLAKLFVGGPNMKIKSCLPITTATINKHQNIDKHNFIIILEKVLVICNKYKKDG